jgi:HSP20 family protein
MLMRTDPFRELDRMTQQRAGTQAQPLAMPMDAFRQGDEFIVDIDLPGIAVDSIDLTIDQNVLTVRAARRRNAQEGVELLIAERPTGEFSRQLLLGETLDVDRIAADYSVCRSRRRRGLGDSTSTRGNPRHMRSTGRPPTAETPEEARVPADR